MSGGQPVAPDGAPTDAGGTIPGATLPWRFWTRSGDLSAWLLKVGPITYQLLFHSDGTIIGLERWMGVNPVAPDSLSCIADAEAVVRREMDEACAAWGSMAPRS